MSEKIEDHAGIADLQRQYTSPPMPVLPDSGLWFILLTEPNMEFKVEKRLGQIIDRPPYVPRETRIIHYSVRNLFGSMSRRVRNVIAPIFRGYLFMPDQPKLPPLDGVPGLRSSPYLRINDCLATLFQSEINMMRAIEERLANPELPRLPYKVGDQVRIMNGPFADRLANISRLDDIERIELLMDLLGAKTKVFAAACQISAA